MEGKKLLIVGIDPGMTTAYAAIDIEGRPISVQSSKGLDLNRIISETIKLGKAVIVGTDKSKIPGLVLDFASKVGARVIAPTEDLKVDDKRKIASEFKTDDSHQMDALAAALFAHREIKILLDKIDSTAEDLEKLHLKDSIKELVLLRKVSIKHAIDILERKDEEDQIIEKVISKREFNEKDFLAIYDKLKRVENENKILRSHSQNLANRIKNAESRPTQRIDTSKNVNVIKKIASLKEQRIRFLENIINNKDRDLDKIKSAIRKLNAKIARINDYYVVKKLDNLGVNEYNLKNRVLNIQKNDMILVDDPAIISDLMVEEISKKVAIIIHKKPVSSKLKQDLPFVFIDAINLPVEEDKYFGFVEKRILEKAKDREMWAEKIISDYKRERSIFRQV